MYYYGTGERSTHSTPEKLRRFAAKLRPPFRSLEELDEYFLEFMRKAGSLVTDGEMLEAEVNLLFYQGLPRKLRAAIRPSLETAQAIAHKELSRMTPPSIKVTLKAARARYDSNDIDYKDHRGDECDSDSESDDDSDPDEHDGTHEGLKTFSAPTRTATPLDNNEVLRALLELVSQRPSEDSRCCHRRDTKASFVDSRHAPRACFMCGKTEGKDLNHRLSLRYCPLTQELIAREVLKFDVTGQLVKIDGSTLPRSRGAGTGGIAALLRPLMDRPYSRNSCADGRAPSPVLQTNPAYRPASDAHCHDGLAMPDDVLPEWRKTCLPRKVSPHLDSSSNLASRMPTDGTTSTSTLLVDSEDKVDDRHAELNVSTGAQPPITRTKPVDSSYSFTAKSHIPAPCADENVIQYNATADGTSDVDSDACDNEAFPARDVQRCPDVASFGSRHTSQPAPWKLAPTTTYAASLSATSTATPFVSPAQPQQIASTMSGTRLHVPERSSRPNVTRRMRLFFCRRRLTRLKRHRDA